MNKENVDPCLTRRKTTRRSFSAPCRRTSTKDVSSVIRRQMLREFTWEKTLMRNGLIHDRFDDYTLKTEKTAITDNITLQTLHDAYGMRWIL